MAQEKKTIICQICKKPKELNEVMPGEMVRASIAETIRKNNPDWSPRGYICLTDLNYYRTKYIQDILAEDRGELSKLEQEVVKSLADQDFISRNLNAEFDQQLKFGQRVTENVAKFGGSWRFIILFAVILTLWITINSLAMLWHPFDPYPYILMNLILSCIAAIQAPVIMMSQNRQESKDRLRAEHDYRVNLKAELEIRHLSEKMDHLLAHQWQRLLEIQQIQIELIEELSHNHPNNAKP